MPITEPGFYEMTPDEYHADPCPAPSLSNSVAQILLDRSPWHAFHAHPRLNPFYVEDEGSKRLDLGSVAHALLLGAGRLIETIDADDYRTKDAREKRDAARKAGRIPALTADMDRAGTMAEIARKQIERVPEIAAMVDSPNAKSETVAVWREGDCWARAMLDRTDLRVVLDYKTCTNANPAALSRHLYGNGYHIQRGFYLRGLDAIDPAGAGRRKFYFLFQEIDEPYACTVMELDGTGATLGARQCDQAVRMWQQCIASGLWPSYPPFVHRAEMPGWMETDILAREIAEDEHRRRPAPMLTSLMGG